MATSDIIALALIVAVIIAALGYLIFKKNEKSIRVSSILKSHPILTMVLLDFNKVPTISSITDEQSEILLSLSESDWDEWEYLTIKVKSIADKYPQTLFDFICKSFPKCKERANYKSCINLFMPIPEKVKIAVASLHLDELRLIDADSENVWKERDDLRVFASKIRQMYPEGYRTYCLIHKVSSPEDSEIANNKKHIAELQKMFDDSKGYEGWEKKQKDFCSDFWQILKDVRSQDGRYTYDVIFNKPNRRGSLVESKFKVWQGFCDSFSSFLLEKQAEEFKASYDKISAFEKRTRYFYDRVYDQIFEIIAKFDEKIRGDLYVIFIDRCKRGWSEMTYDYHYGHLREKIDESDIRRFDFSDLPFLNDNSNIGGIFILDFITSNEELMNNCKLIIEHFNKSVPLIGYYSMIKEYDEEELKELAKKHEGFLEDKKAKEKKDIELIKHRLLQVRKHDFFSYLAIPNTWIGEASQSDSTREVWLSQPSKYHFKLIDKVGEIACEYSVDGRRTYQEFSVEGDTGDIDDVTLFTYHLLKKMNVLEEFRQKGNKAVEFMNKQGILAYH